MYPKRKNLADRLSVSFKKLLLITGVLLTPTSCCLFSDLPELPKYEEVMVNGKKQYLPKELLGELPDFLPKEESKKDDQESAGESATEKIEDDLSKTFSWLAKISAILGVLLGAFGVIHPGLGKLGLGRWLLLVSACSIGALYFIPYFPFIFGGAAFVLFAFLCWKLYRVVKEKVELERLADHLSIADREESKDIMKAHQIKNGLPRPIGTIPMPVVKKPRATVKIKE